MNPPVSLPSSDELTRAHELLNAAAMAGRLSSAAAANIRIWLDDDRYRPYRSQVVQHIKEEKFQKLDDVFWTVIPFGTGGRRGRMYPIGSNAINERTIGESAQGLADHVRESKPGGPWSIAIAYDTRHRSREFAELCAGIMVANGFHVFFIDDFRSTPELSFLIRFKNCDCGIMVTASHNPPSDNAVKVYWSNGAQLIPPHDQAVIAKVAQVGQISAANFQESVTAGRISLCRDEADSALLAEHVKLSFPGPRNLKVIFSPLHGVGEFNVKNLLNAVGFASLEIYERHRQPNGDFPNVPGHVSNPENAAVFDEIIVHAQQNGAELILASDPDCDRMGAAAPVTMDSKGPWKTFNGNQLSAMLADYVLSQRKEQGRLSKQNYVITTLVTTRLVRRICDAFGVTCHDDCLVGFKWICSLMDQIGPADFVYGTEESHGFLVGQHCRDKDGAVACLMMSELAAKVKATGKSLFDYLDSLYLKYGYHGERLITIQMEGSDGMRRMKDLMDAFRSKPPKSIGGLQVSRIRDYLNSKISTVTGSISKLEGPVDNLIFLETETAGNYVAARPSGTEPKVKFYLFTYQMPTAQIDLSHTRRDMDRRLDGFGSDLKKFAESIP